MLRGYNTRLAIVGELRSGAIRRIS